MSTQDERQGQTLELVSVPLKHGFDLTQGEGLEILRKCQNIISSQPGCKALFWGRRIEHPDIVQLVVEWDDISSHKRFQSSPPYGPFRQALTPILSAPLKIHHILIPPSSTPYTIPLCAPVTECLALYFSPSSPHLDTFLANNWASFSSALQAEAPESKGITGGWAIEKTVASERMGAEGEAGPAREFGGFIGWESVEDHMAFRSRKGFEGVVAHLRDGPEDLEMWHVRFERFK
ncbi:uncharacterized protein EI97DRAFT_456850 [Westerdykella ornata]|uniref:ABM domain-containing protein n=1 Tax=Westerdykella ornata TaxID=318751 RepID=A0A6A6JQB6_WESOR|nr:uncharacterized protein EI97DRAFT_456850 [Westerdykella ornata]KAF2278455.1 hypothetical protein EI97DRAFT_456850 [Westerdykella ornata]